MKKLLLLILIGTIASQVFAQNQKADSSAKEPKTKLEAFEAQTGVVIIRVFSTAGTVKGKLGTRILIECREFTEASSGKSEYGIAIGVAGRFRPAPLTLITMKFVRYFKELITSPK